MTRALLLLALLLGLICSTQAAKFQRHQSDADFEDELLEDDLIGEEEEERPILVKKNPAATSTIPKSTTDEQKKNNDAHSTPQVVTETAKPAPDTFSKRAAMGFVEDRSYYLEMLYAILIVIYFIFFWFGRRGNEAVVKAWGGEYQTLFRDNFTKVGDKAMIAKDSQSEFKLYATGRKNCHGLEATVKLKRRHDIFTRVFNIISPADDLVVFEVPLLKMNPWVLAIATKRGQRNLFSECPDIKENAVAWPNVLPGLEDVPLVVWTDCPEVIPLVVNNQVAQTIKTYLPLFVSIYVTDSAKHTTYKKQLRVTYKLPSIDKMEELATLMRMLFYLIDTCAKIKLPAQAKARAEKRRSKAVEEARKAKKAAQLEAAAAKKEAKLAEETKKGLSEEQLRKREAKERRKQLKKRQGKFKIMFS